MISANSLVKGFSLEWTPSREIDVVGYVVHWVAADDPVFINGTFTPNASNLKHRGPETKVTFNTNPGTYFFRVAPYDLFEDVDNFAYGALNYSPATATSALDLKVLPDELYGSLRTDFWVKDSIFNFTHVDLPGVASTTLNWTVGSIIRDEVVYALAAGGAASASNKYVKATLTLGTPNTAAISLADFGGVPVVDDNQVIIAVTSAAPASTNNYICFMRQANSMEIEGAIIRDATIGDAKISGTLSANRIQTLNGAVTINGEGITLTGIKETAAAGVGDAAAAQEAANTANSEIANMSLDDKISPVEKITLKRDWDTIVAEKSLVDAQAALYSVSVVTYGTTYDALNTYLNTTITVFVDITVSTDLGAGGGAWLRAKFTEYYTEKINVLNAVARETAERATWGNVSGRPEDVSNLIKKGTFEDSSMGTWNGFGVENRVNVGSPYNLNLVTSAADTVEVGGAFPVKSGEIIYGAAWLETLACAHRGHFGLYFYDAANTPISFLTIFTLETGTAWTYLQGSCVVPSGVVTARPWLNIEGFTAGDYLRATGLWLGRHALGATQNRASQGASPHANPQTGDTFYCNSAGSYTVGVLYQYTGSDWVTSANYVTGTHINGAGIYTGTLTATQVNAVAINAGSITTGTLDATQVTISGDVVTIPINSVLTDVGSTTVLTTIWGVIDLVTTASTVNKPHYFNFYGESSASSVLFIVRFYDITDTIVDKVVKVPVLTSVYDSTTHIANVSGCYTPTVTGTHKIYIKGYSADLGLSFTSGNFYISVATR